MVSFQCETADYDPDTQACGDVLTKKKLDPHRNRCRGASYSCIDCMTYFNGNDYRSHTSCMTEDQKYQGALYKGNKKAKLNPPTYTAEANSSAVPATPKPQAGHRTDRTMAAAVQSHQPAHVAYVEDVPEDLNEYLVADDDDNASRSSDEALPHAPTPPPAAEEPVNVFDFLVASATPGATPNASNLELQHGTMDAVKAVKLSDSTQMVRYEYDAKSALDTPELAMAMNMNEDRRRQLLLAMADGSAPAAAAFRTPAPGERAERKKKDKDGNSSDKDTKKNKKRKRLFLDIHDQVMTDAPPVLQHSGLTGGLNRLTTTSLPSPESAETPASPLKKSKSSKHHAKTSRSEVIGGNLFSMLKTSSKTKTKKRKHRSSSLPTEKKTHRSHRHKHRHESDKAAAADASGQKLLEYSTSKKDGDKTETEGQDNQVIVYKPRADLFLSFVNKGPESDRGCSLNKALKRYHRELNSSGVAIGKHEEKELFRSLRLRKNDRGEIVLFCA